MTTTARITLAVAVLVGIIVVAFILFRAQKDTPPLGGPAIFHATVFLIDDHNGGCRIDENNKQDLHVLGEHRQILWSINHDGCADKQAVVTLGNFRRDPKPTTVPNCHDAKTPGADGIWLFAQPQEREHRQSRSQIALTTRGRAEVDKGTYHYDMCAGADAEKKVDPQLVIEY